MSKLTTGFKADENIEAEDWNAAGDEGEELITIGLFLKPGDVVELTQPGREPVLAVFVQQLDINSQFFSVNGRWCHSVLSRVAFAITGCIDPALLEPLLPFLPTDPFKANPKGDLHVPTNLATPVQRILERMTVEAERIYRANAPILDTAYAVLADPNRTRMMTLTQIAKTLLGQNDPAWTPSPAALLAVRKSLNHNEFRFRSDVRSHRLTNVFAIRPKHDVQVVETVHEWIREHREHLAMSVNKTPDAGRKRSKGATNIIDFLGKARRLIALSRKDREPNMGTVGPSKTRSSTTGPSSLVHLVWGETFTSTDKQIINFLQAWVLTNQFQAMPGLHSACANLVLSTECYGKGTIQNSGVSDAEAGEMNRGTGMLFLQEIGVISPFENRAIYDEQLMLPTVRLSRNLELLNTKAELTRKNPDFRDSMAHLRHDWGPLTVYCIDDAGAQEIDDGVSIERVKEDTSEYWIRIHVANPTAFFDKTHTLSGLAAHMTESVYTPEQSFPMLPSWATQGHFSLERNRPVLTFSSRINENGDILETNIQPGIVRKVVNITNSDVSALLGDGEQATQELHKLVVGGDVPIDKQTRKKPQLSTAEVEDLRNLYKAARALWANRRLAGGIRISTAESRVNVYGNTDRAGLTWNPPSLDRARLIRGDPIIELTSRVRRSSIQFEISPANIVEEMMMLACRTAASWCTERQIPVMYRGTIAPPTNDTMSSDELKNQLVLPYFEKHGEVPHGLALRYMRSLGRAIAHSAPLPHKIIGVPGYVKVTSPLRRFSDMIAHWQIEAAIRYEARSGQKLKAGDVSTAPRGVLPFTHRQMQESIVTLSPRERIIQTTKRNSARFWILLALMRAFYYKEAQLPEVFTFLVSPSIDRSPSHLSLPGAMGDLPYFGVKAKMSGAPDVQIGDQWEVQLQRIDVYSGTVDVKPVRLVHREDGLL
jgi:hypothetical protein